MPDSSPGSAARGKVAEEAAELARAFRRGLPAAVERVRGQVRRIVAFRAYGVPADEREDLVQEVMAQLWRRAAAGGDGGARFPGLVKVVAVRRCIDRLRVDRPAAPIDPGLAEERPGPLERTLDRERRGRAFRALAELDEPCRRLVYLQAGLGLSYREIAGIVGGSEGSLRVQMYRCVRKARALLEEGGPARAGGPRSEE